MGRCAGPHARARYAVNAMQAHAPIRTWVVDDTGFLKQGRHSPGVQRQYTGTAGKTT
ncbi:MAG TPA: transposase, partial [Polyangiales bacterium]|nr:transposase [Polyangiales bacterium]